MAIICNVAHVSEKSVYFSNIPTLLLEWITPELLMLIFRKTLKHLTFVIICLSLLKGPLIMFTKVAQKRCYKKTYLLRKLFTGIDNHTFVMVVQIHEIPCLTFIIRICQLEITVFLFYFRCREMFLLSLTTMLMCNKVSIPRFKLPLYTIVLFYVDVDDVIKT